MSTDLVEKRILACRASGGSNLSLLGLNLNELPDAIRQFKSLRGLNLGQNNLSSIPSWIVEFQELQLLWLFGNKITHLPEEVGSLRKLERIWLRQNDLISLPKSLSELSHLETLELTGNVKLGMPPEILIGKPADILTYYFKLATRTRPLNEAKIQIVGQGGVGKTSIVNRLLSGTFDENQPKTEGINIGRMYATTPRKRDQIRINIWDFGGQEIMHATHQFFLSKRSLYVLVLDARAGEKEGNLHYWLEMIRVYGADSPIMIVINKCDEHFERLDETRIRLDCETKVNLRGFYYVSCKTETGFKELKHAIETLVSELPHVDDLLPHDYFEVKKLLEDQATNTDFITEDGYLQLCRKHNINSNTEAIKLLRFLHDLGCVLNYDDTEQVYQLRDTKVLNPHWVTTGIYQILNDPELIRNADGVISRRDLGRLLHSTSEGLRRYPASRFSFLFDIMRKFDLCFDFSDGSGKVLVPELLSRNEPDVGWYRSKGSEALDFEYHYGVLPRGLIPRFIVQTQHLLTPSRTCWRAGVVLQLEGCRALVRADLRLARVFVQVQGPSGQRRRALAIIRSAFDAIHLSFGNLDVDAKVPLSRDPFAPPVDYKYLQQLEQEGVVEQRFEKAREKYSIRELLDGIDDRAVVYDLFLSHNSEDKPIVRKLHNLLRRKGVRCWIDEDDLTPGKLWQSELIEALNSSTAIAVIIGSKGPGNWQLIESQIGLLGGASCEKKIIPILLPGVDKTQMQKEPSFQTLRLRTWIDLSTGLREPAITKLFHAIRATP